MSYHVVYVDGVARVVRDHPIHLNHPERIVRDDGPWIEPDEGFDWDAWIATFEQGATDEA